MSSTQVTYFNAVLPPEASHGGMNMVKGSKRCEGVCLTCDGLIRGLRGYFRSSLPLTNKLLDAFLSRIRLCPHLQGNRTGLKGKRKPYHITRAIASTGKLEEEAVATEAPTLGKTSSLLRFQGVVISSLKQHQEGASQPATRYRVCLLTVWHSIGGSSEKVQ
eukprot:4088923-Pyramimonas_sp.AAC.1